MSDNPDSTDNHILSHEELWRFIDNKGESKGPVPCSFLQRLLENNINVSGQTVVWKEGMTEWKSLQEVFFYVTSYL